MTEKPNPKIENGSSLDKVLAKLTTKTFNADVFTDKREKTFTISFSPSTNMELRYTSAGNYGENAVRFRGENIEELHGSVWKEVSEEEKEGAMDALRLFDPRIYRQKGEEKVQNRNEKGNHEVVIEAAIDDLDLKLAQDVKDFHISAEKRKIIFEFTPEYDLVNFSFPNPPAPQETIKVQINYPE